MKQQEIRTQHIGLPEFMREARQSINARCAGAWGVSFAIFVPFSALGYVPLWFGAVLSLAWSGIILWDSHDVMMQKIDQWVSSLSVVNTTTKEDGEPKQEDIPIKESEINIDIETRTGRHRYDVAITTEQLLQLIEAANYGDHLVRSSLTVGVFPSLSEEWRLGNIQRKAKRLGLIGYDNRFVFEWGGVYQDDYPEVEQETDTLDGVGGSQ